MSALFLLASTFGLVFALGLQSQLVNNGHHVGAFFNSLAIGACNLVLFKLAPDASGLEVAAYLAGGPFGIVASMAVYRRIQRRKSPARRGPNADELAYCAGCRLCAVGAWEPHQPDCPWADAIPRSKA